MKILSHDIGVCSWSLHPTDELELVDFMRQLDLQHLQLALGNPADLDMDRETAKVKRIRDAGIIITAGMIGFPGEDYSSIAAIKATGGYVPDSQWSLRRQISAAAAQFAAESLNIHQISTHVGFIPPPADPHYEVMVERIHTIAEDFAEHGVNLLMETGQERADELRDFLGHLKAANVFVNFDPANMILYGIGDPIEAISILGPFIRHVHIKDARASKRPAIDWGEEVPFGQGEVGPRRFLQALTSVGYRGPLIIEREAGRERLVNVQEAVEALRASAAN